MNFSSKSLNAPITLESLQETYRKFRKDFVPLPPYYRVNTLTYERLKSICVSDRVAFPHLATLEIRIDESVPDGEAHPPIGWQSEIQTDESV